MIPKGNVSLGILAGGRASRLGGVDKAFAVHAGQPLLVRSLGFAGRGFREMLVGYNGSDPRVRELGVIVVPDLRPNRPGPLAAIEALLLACTGSWLLTFPVDLLALPEHVLVRMMTLALQPAGAQGVVIADADGLQPLVALWPVVDSRAAASDSLDNGELAARDLVQRLAFARCDISPFRLGNLNTPADFG